MASLRSPTIYGGIDSKKYIVEANGCGCAFMDYDNDGWTDIFLLCGPWLEGNPVDATNRFIQEQSRRHFTDVTKDSGL